MKKILLLVAVIAASFSLNAQRTVDMEVTLNSPSNGDPIRAGQQFDLEFTLKNNGPDDIKAGDSVATFLVLGTTIQNSTGSVMVLTAGIPKDSTFKMTRTGFNVSGGSSGNLQVCALAVLNNRGGADTVRDNVPSGNNVSCATTTYSVGLGDELNSSKLNANVYPNPVSSAGAISYTLAANTEVSVKIFDLAGRQVLSVFEGTKEAGDHTEFFNVSDLKDGIYLYQIQAGDISTTNKLIIRK